ncbi:hypothetical protein HDZ31DRAFT_62392 [Schizophyllum fasciatum]
MPAPRTSEWELFRHPKNGDVYFYSQRYRIITADDVSNGAIENSALRCRSKVDGLLARHHMDQFGSVDWDLIRQELYDLVRDKDGVVARNTGPAFWLQVAEYPCHRVLPEQPVITLESAVANPLSSGRLLSRPGNGAIWYEYAALKDTLKRSKYPPGNPQWRHINGKITWRLAVLMADWYDLRLRRLI